MKKFFLFMAAAATAMTLGLSSCHSGDDDDDRAVVDDNELVSSDLPAEGWSGDSETGVYKYGLTDESHEFGSYFAIRMNGNVCSEAVYNVVMTTAAAARQMSDILSNGTWAQKIEDDDDEYYAPEHRAMNMAVSVMQRISEMNAARSYAYLPISGIMHRPCDLRCYARNVRTHPRRDYSDC